MAKKTKAKKMNRKLKRTVLRTISALMMIMAVVVAAIPVEQYGSMNAQTNLKNGKTVQELYDAYVGTNETGSNDYEFKTVSDIGDSAYDKQTVTAAADGKGQTVLLQDRGNGNYVLGSQFYYVDRKNASSSGVRRGVLVNYNSDYVHDAVTIDDTLYQDYWIITPDFISDFEKALSTQTYSVKVGNSTASLNAFQGVSIPSVADNKPAVSISYDGFPQKLEWKENGNGYGNAGSFTLSDASYISYYKNVIKSQTYNYRSGISSLNFFTKYATDTVFDTYTTADGNIKNYNDNIDKLITRIQTLEGKCASVTTDNYDSLVAEWNSIKADITTLKNSTKPDPDISMTVTEALNTLSGTPAEYDYFCSRVNILGYDSGTGTRTQYSLDGFKLISVLDKVHFNSQSGDAYSLIPQWIKKSDDDSVSISTDLYNADGDAKRSQQLDPQGYVTTGTVSIVGIGNEVFSGQNTSITSITLSDQLEFIGTKAFMNLSSLQSVTFKNCSAIGNYAFKGCRNLSSVNFTGGTDGGSNLSEIGTESFANTTSLREIPFPDSVTNVGPGAFYGSGLNTFSFSNKVSVNIWPFAFCNCINLSDSGDGTTEGSFFRSGGTNQKIVIGQGAFSVTADTTGNMKDFVFPEVMNKIISDVAFKALESGKEITYDYILAGRNKLEHVTFPKGMGYSTSASKSLSNKIPDNTLMGCSNLKYATFGEISHSGQACNAVWYDGSETSDDDNDGEYLFQDVTTSEGFYVEGPGYFVNNGSIATSPRQSTWEAQSNALDNIPYKYLDADGTTCLEIPVDKGKYLASVEITSEENHTAKIVDFTARTEGTIRELVIPSKAGEYNITELATGCFSHVKDKVIELTISDGTIESLEPGAFSGSKTLQQANIGNSVKEIGSDAFKNCTKLQNVYFSEPLNVSASSSNEEWANVMKVGSGAFETGSELLTFHGAVHSGYEPFEHAMGDNTIGSSKVNICYRTDNPMNLTIIRDNSSGLATCIDYPHYEDIDVQNKALIQEMIARYQTNYAQQGLPEYSGPGSSASPYNYSIIQKWEDSQGFRSWPAFTNSGMNMENEETDVVLATLFMNIPNGIQSIDAKKYFQQITDNNKNFKYFTTTYSEDSDGINQETTSRNVNYVQSDHNVQSLYSEDKTSGSTTTHGGLFSGHFVDKNLQGAGITGEYGMVGTNVPFKYKTYNHTLVEEVENGNDNLLTMTMNSVESLPDYAFESCENLLSVGLGSEMKDVGTAPFRGDKNLTSITGNNYFTCDNGILYGKGPNKTGDYTLNDGEYRVIECLESRGDIAFSKAIPSTTGVSDADWSKVTSVSDEAFAYCTALSSVDFSDTSITEIPEGCFLGDTSLRYVSLPKTVSGIDSKAFTNCTSIPDVYIYNPSCQIESDAFDEGGAIIHGYQYTDNSKTSLSPVYNFAKKHDIEFHDLGTDFTVIFYNHDGTIIETQSVKEGTNAVLPDDPVRSGYDFTGWAWEKSDGTLTSGKDAYQNVNENRVLIAQYTIANGGGTTDGKSYNLTMVSGTANGSSTNPLSVMSGSIVTVTCATAETGKRFAFWSSSATTTDATTGTVTTSKPVTFTSEYLETTTFIMPTTDCTVTANYVDSSSGGGSNNGGTGTGDGDNNNNNNDDTTTKYKLTVNYGSGSGEYKEGETVAITANAPESNSKVFSFWTTTTSEISFASKTSVTTSITMPGKDATVTANYKSRSDDDDDDDDDDDSYRSDRDSNTSSTTTTPGTNPSTGNTPSAQNNDNNNNGNSSGNGTDSDRLDISKDGISNKDVGSATVDGSTDNFVVKITDSDEARAAIEQALTGKFGSLDGIEYFPMDIKLYDNTGNNVITDTSGLSVNITIPIPDDMIQYGGNNKVGAVANSQLEDLVPKFTTIDGIGCVTFTATHFSPYAIYVDTNNLVAGQMMDATPATGDGIHPKWFLVIGFACMSVVLFVLGDNKKKLRVAVK